MTQRNKKTPSLCPQFPPLQVNWLKLQIWALSTLSKMFLSSFLPSGVSQEGPAWLSSTKPTLQTGITVVHKAPWHPAAQDTPEDGIKSCNCFSIFHLQTAQEKSKNHTMDVRLKNNNELGLYEDKITHSINFNYKGMQGPSSFISAIEKVQKGKKLN